ncbi:50S ribosomal protein L24 [Patescibacteria group bacterium]|nr:50S ribosomal protein L24 [Patescibacteria group bacterium]MBU1703516.1 50S ribosomal protein L24 [Patescibacteria group bacterium]MBU1953423.1 50S ribosomal protein L24 [Patescibacteria group bacterium]
MKLKLNDKVLAIAGKDRGKSGKIIKVDHKHGRVTVEKLNMRTKHIRKTQQRAGEKITYEAPMHASNVMILDPKENKPTRISYKKLANGKKERISKISGISLDLAPMEAPKGEKKETKTPSTSKKKTIKA